MRPKSAGIMLIVAILLGISGTACAATFKMAVGDAQGGTQWELASFFKQSLERKTQGVHRVVLFPNGQLGSEEDTINEAAMGTLDMSVLAINNLAPFSPTLSVLTLPYIVRNADEARTLVQGEIGRELVDNTVRDAQVRIVGWAFSGFRVLTNSRKPVTNPEDLSGMVIRVPKNEVMIETYQAWGINPSPLAWSETFTALQQKVVDGQDNPFITVAAMKFDEVQKYITPIRYLFSLEPLVISEEVFQHQTPAMQDAILAAGRGATTICSGPNVRSGSSCRPRAWRSLNPPGAKRPGQRWPWSVSGPASTTRWAARRRSMPPSAPWGADWPPCLPPAL